MTTLFGDNAISTSAPIAARISRKKLGWLPLLTVLFCISYALMTMLIIEQGSTIESQRALIRELFRDSVDLSVAKMKSQLEKNSHLPSAKAQSQAPLNQVPSTQIPSTQAQNQAPSSQAAPNRGHNPAQKVTPQSQMPPRPAADLVDARRSLLTI